MKKTIFSVLAIAASTTLFAQANLTSVLSSIEQNNSTLKALRESADAEKLANRTDIFLPDPEVGLNYLWGYPSEVPNRTDFSASQSFDIPTISGQKSRMANQTNELINWQYRIDRMNILLEAKMYCIDLIYYNALLKELSIRLSHAMEIESLLKKGLETGKSAEVDYNSALLNLLAAQGEVSRIGTERDATIAQLIRLNGGQNVALEMSEYPQILTPTNFEQWYASIEDKSPMLGYVNQETVVSNKQVSLSKTTWLPTFSLGYMREDVPGEHYQGASFGISVPLWANKNKVRQAKLAVRAAESRKADAQQQFYNQLNIAYVRMLGQKRTAELYQASLSKVRNCMLLKDALDSGQISIFDYVDGIEAYYDIFNQVLETECDFQKSYAELTAVEL